MVTNRVVLSFALAAALITSCGPSPEQIQTAIAATQAAIPTATVEPTATPKPITGADLDPLFLVRGDLPEEYVAQQVKLDPPDYWPKATLYRGVHIEYGEGIGAGGAVEVGVFDPPVDDDMFYKMGGQSGESVEGLGDASGLVAKRDNFFRDFFGVLVDDVTLVWRRCNYVASIDLTGSGSGDTIATYGRLLDERLARVLCP